MKKKVLNDIIPFGDKDTNLEWLKFCPNCGTPMRPTVMFLHHFNIQGDNIPYKQFNHLCKHCAIMYKRVSLLTDEEYEYICESENLAFGDNLDISSYKRFQENAKRMYDRDERSQKVTL